MADTSNAKVLKARVDFDISSAEQKLQKLSNKIKTINNAFSNISKDNDALTNNLKRSNTQAKKLETTTNKVDKNIKNTTTSSKNMVNQLRANDSAASKLRSRFDAVHNKIKLLPNAMRSFTSSIRNSTNAAKETEDVFDRIYGKVKGIAAAYGGIMGAKALVNLSDTMTSAQNRLNDYNSQQLGNSGIATNPDGTTAFSDKTLNLTTSQMDKMFAASQRARVGYDEFMANTSKSMVLAGDAFNDNMDNAIRFQEIMGKAYTLGGASAAEQASSMYQMIQALGSGTLAGDELRSVREGAPMAYQAIEGYAQRIYNCEDSLKDMASQGLITSDIVVAAMMEAGDSIDERFDMTAMTFGQAFTMMKNTAIQSFRPILAYMNEFLNSETGQEFLNIINEIIVAISYAVAIIVRAVSAVITFIVNNWDWISELLLMGVTFIAGFIVFKITRAVATVIATTIRLIMTNPTVALVALIVTLICGLILHIAQTSESVYDFLCQLVYSILMIVAGVLTLIAVASIATGNLVVGAFALGVLIVIALLAALAYMFLKYTDVVLGIIFAAGAIIYNNVAATFNAIMQFIWSMFVEPISGIIEWFVNAFNGGFDSILDGFVNLLGQMLSNLIGFVKPIAKLLDTVFGWDTNGMIESAQAQMSSWGKNSNAVTYEVAAPELNRLDITDSYNSGSEKGAALQDKLQNMNISDLVGSITGMDGLTDLTQGLPDPNDPAYALTPDDYGAMVGDGTNPALNDIAGDTSKISDSMDILDTDLKYLKELGEREAINQFTTAEIKVEMKNDNYISERVDMDGVVNYLSDKLYEELGVVANGVHY